MGFFKSKEEKELDAIIRKLEMNMSNNYKDNARDNLKELEDCLNVLCASKGLQPKVMKKYEDLLDSYKERMVGFSHKDQKPFWH